MLKLRVGSGLNQLNKCPCFCPKTEVQCLCVWETRGEARAPRRHWEGVDPPPRGARASGQMDGVIVLTRGKDEEEEEENSQPHVQQGGCEHQPETQGLCVLCLCGGGCSTCMWVKKRKRAWKSQEHFWVMDESTKGGFAQPLSISKVHSCLA